MVRSPVKLLSSPSFYLFILGLGIFYPHDFTVANDMGEYMVYGLNIFFGKGYTAMDGSPVLFRGPVFPAMIAFSYLLGGMSPWSSFWVVRLFCILTPVMLYFLGKKLFGKGVGLGAALLVLSSYSINYWAYRHIDAIWPFFIFAAFYLLIKGFEQGKSGLFALSGISMGIAFLTKEVAVLCFPFPLLLALMVKEYRGNKLYKKLSVFYGFLIISLSPWFYYVAGKGELKEIFKAGSGFARVTAASDSFWSMIPGHVLDFFQGIFQFYHGHNNSVDANFILAPLFVLALVYTIYKAVVKQHQSCRVVLCALILFVPVIQLMGSLSIRLGQGLYFYYLSFLLVSFLAFDLSKNFSGLLQKRKKQVSITFIFTIVISSLLVIQASVPHKRDKGGLAFMKHSYAASFFSGMGQRQMHRLYTAEQKTISGEMDEIFLDAQGIMVCDRKAYITYWKSIYFFLGAKAPVYLTPFWFTYEDPENVPTTGRNKNDLILIDSKSGNTSALNFFILLFEQDLFRAIREQQVDYVVLENSSPLLPYFESNNSFRQIKKIGRKPLKIFKIGGDLEKNALTPRITSQASSYYIKLSKKEPEMLKRLVKNFFQPLLGLDKGGIDMLLVPAYGTNISLQ